MALTTDPNILIKEFERIKPLLEKWGYIPSVDHAVPASVPFKHYVYYIDKLRKVVGKFSLFL